MFLGSNIVVLYSAQYSVGYRTGKDRDSEIWTCKKMQARQHCFDSKRNVTKQSRATFPLLSVHEGHSTQIHFIIKAKPILRRCYKVSTRQY